MKPILDTTIPPPSLYLLNSGERQELTLSQQLQAHKSLPSRCQSLGSGSGSETGVHPTKANPHLLGSIFFCSKSRKYFFSIKQILYIIHSSSTPGSQESLVHLDAEKTFDYVGLDSFFKTLHWFHLGESFIAWVKLLYTSLLASVHTINVVSPYSELQQGSK